MNHTTNPHGKVTPGEQIKAFCTLYESDDLLEIRRLPSGRKTWHLTGELFEQAESLAATTISEKYRDDPTTIPF